MIYSQVQPSMEDDEFNGQVCFSQDELISCDCSCKSGAAGKEQEICVHILVKAVQLCHLFLQEFVDNTIHELAVQWKNGGPSDLDSEIEAQVVTHLCQLLTVIEDGLKFSQLIDPNQKLSELLWMFEEFQVGTEKSKLPPIPPKPNFGYHPL